MIVEGLKSRVLNVTTIQLQKVGTITGSLRWTPNAIYGWGFKIELRSLHFFFG